MRSSKILEIREKIDDAQKEVNEGEGVLKDLFKRMKEGYGVGTIAKAKKKVEELEEKASKLRSAFKKAMNKLETKYDW